MTRPIIVAHRGASGYRPEHSAEAYRLAASLGADMIEPDIVATRDGVLVLRHENEISGTTDIAAHPEFASRRTTKVIDGVALTGWFTEDFTWDELRGLRVRERMPRVRQANTTFDGQGRILRLTDLMRILDDTGLGMVAEIKHATYFESIGLPLDELVADALRAGGWATGSRERLIVESFEQRVLGQVAARGIEARYVSLLEKAGAPADLVAAHGAAAPTFASQLTDAGLARLANEVDGISVDKAMLFDRRPAHVTTNDLIDRAHAAGLDVFTWTLRPENRFLEQPHRRGTRAFWWGDWMREWDVLMNAGLDGVFADHPDLAIYVADRATGDGRPSSRPPRRARA